MNDDAPKDDPATRDPSQDRKAARRRHWLIGLGTFVGVAVVLALVVFVLPRYAARLYVDHKLEKAGLVSQGVETIDVDFWNREIVFGPIAVGRKDEEPAKLSYFSLTFSLEALFDQRGFVPTVLIRGVDLVVTRDTDGRLLVNNVQIFSPSGDRSAESGDAREGRPLEGWGFGLGSLSVRDSRLVFHEKAFEGGGTVVVQIDQLDLSDFQTWTPDDPGRFDLDARINDIHVNVEGTAKPFADQIAFSAVSEVAEASFDKVERFTGPIEFVRTIGAVSSRLRHEGTLRADGTLTLSNAGKITVQNGILQLPGDLSLATDKFTLDFDLENAVAPDLSGHVSGRLSATLEKVRAESEAGVATAASANLEVDRVEAARWLEGGEQAIRSFLAPGRLVIRDLALSRPTGETAAVAQISTALDRLSMDQSVDGAVAVELAGALDTSKVTARLPPPDSGSASIGTLRLGNISARVDIPAEAALDWRARLDAKGTGFSVDLAGEDAFQTSAEKIVLSEAVYSSAAGMTAKALTVTGLNGEVAGASLQSNTVALRDIAGKPPAEGQEGAGWEGGLSVDAKGISLTVAAAGNLQASASGLDLKSASYNSAKGVTAKALRLSGLAARSELGSLRTDAFTIQNLSADPSAGAADDGGWKIGLSAETEGVEVTVRDGKPLTAVASRLELEEGSYSADAGLAASALRVFGLDAKVERSIASAFDDEEPDDEAAGPRFRLGVLAVGDAARIQYADTPQKTPVTINAKIEKFRLEKLDSEPTSPSPVTLDATINEYASIHLDGTVTPFADTPLFDVKGQIQNIALPQYSPYVEEYAGFFVETGTMSISGKGQVSPEGALDALMKLDVKNLKFAAVTDERAKEVASRTGGLNPNAAANWLQDSQGKIELSIPISGNINEPKFDLEQVVAKAIGGAIRSTIATTLKVVFPPALLISALQGAQQGIAIKPVTFEPLGASLEGTNAELLASLSELLKNRPRISVNVCGHAVKADVEAFVEAQAEALRARSDDAREDGGDAGLASAKERLLQNEVIQNRAQEELSALANERTRVVRQALTEDHGVDPGRIGECRAAYSPEDTGPPRTGINF